MGSLGEGVNGSVYRKNLSLQSVRSHSERVGTFSQLRSISRALSGERGVSEKDWEGARKAVLVQDKR